MENEIGTIATQLLIGAAVGVAIGAALILVGNLIWMAKNPEVHPFPGVTRCRVCEKRIYVWQRRERRSFTIKVDNPDGLWAGTASASGIIHKACPGNPEIEMRVTVNRS